MGKLVIGISAGVTAFILALTAGAVYAYRNAAATNTKIAAQQPVSQVGTRLQLAAPPAPAAMPNVSPQDAASIAAKSINRTDLYSIELTDYQGKQAYKVTFSSGDIVYVGLDGQVLGSEVPPAPIFVTQSNGGSSHGGGGSESSSSGEHDDHEGSEGGGD